MSEDLRAAFAAHGMQLRWSEHEPKLERVLLLFDAPCEQYNRHKRPGTWLDYMKAGESVEDVVRRYRRWEKGAALAH